MYVIKFGVLDGAAGFEFCRFISTYDSLVALKPRELLRQPTRGALILQISRAQREASVEPYGVADDFGWKTVALE